MAFRCEVAITTTEHPLAEECVKKIHTSLGGDDAVVKVYDGPHVSSANQ